MMILEMMLLRRRIHHVGRVIRLLAEWRASQEAQSLGVALVLCRHACLGRVLQRIVMGVRVLEILWWLHLHFASFSFTAANLLFLLFLFFLLNFKLFL